MSAKAPAANATPPIHPLLRPDREYPFVVLDRMRERLAPPGITPISFSIGDPRERTPEFIKDALKNAIPEMSSYPSTNGQPALRAAAAGWLERRFAVKADPEKHILPATGTKEAVFLLHHVVLAPGSSKRTVVIPSPAYPVYDAGTRFCGGEPYLVPLRSEDRWHFDPSRVPAEVWERTALLWLNSPHNPTGAVLKPETVEGIAALARKHSFWILSDEIYARLQYEGRHLSIASLPGMSERTVVLDGFSKTYAMTGWRLGFGIMPKPLAVHVTRLMTNCNSCTASFVQRAGMAALTGPQGEMHAMVQEFKVRRDTIVKGLNQIPGIRCAMPKGAFYVFPNITGTGMKSKELATALLEEAGVAGLAGTSFGAFGDGYLRFSYANSLENINTALAAIGDYVGVRAKA